MQGRLPMHFAAYGGQIAIVEYLESAATQCLDARTLDGSSALHAASQANRLEMVKHLLSQRASVHSSSRHGVQPLHIATEAGHHLITKYLIIARAELNAPTTDLQEPLQGAARNGHFHVVELLVQQ